MNSLIDALLHLGAIVAGLIGYVAILEAVERLTLTGSSLGGRRVR